MKKNGSLDQADKSEASIAYLAGIIDGEGTIYIRSKRLSTGNMWLGAGLKVASTSIQWLHDLRARWGNVGGMYYRAKCGHSYECNCSPRVEWTMSGDVAREVIRLIRPYLGIKHEQADIVLSLPRSAGTGHKFSVEDKKTLAESKLKVMELNRRGAVPDETHIDNFKAFMTTLQ